jgi:hypothetical protein
MKVMRIIANFHVQISIASQGSSTTPSPDHSIEVDDVDRCLARMKRAGYKIEH